MLFCFCLCSGCVLVVVVCLFVCFVLFCFVCLFCFCLCSGCVLVVVVCLFVCLFVFVYLFAWLFGWLVDWLVGWLVAWFCFCRLRCASCILPQVESGGSAPSRPGVKCQDVSKWVKFGRIMCQETCQNLVFREAAKLKGHKQWEFMYIVHRFICLNLLCLVGRVIPWLAFYYRWWKWVQEIPKSAWTRQSEVTAYSTKHPLYAESMASNTTTGVHASRPAKIESQRVDNILSG